VSSSVTCLGCYYFTVHCCYFKTRFDKYAHRVSTRAGNSKSGRGVNNNKESYTHFKTHAFPNVPSKGMLVMVHNITCNDPIKHCRSGSRSMTLEAVATRTALTARNGGLKCRKTKFWLWNAFPPFNLLFTPHLHILRPHCSTFSFPLFFYTIFSHSPTITLNKLGFPKI